MYNDKNIFSTSNNFKNNDSFANQQHKKLILIPMLLWTISITLISLPIIFMVYLQGILKADERGYSQPLPLSRTELGWQSAPYCDIESNWFFGKIKVNKIECYEIESFNNNKKMKFFNRIYNTNRESERDIMLQKNSLNLNNCDNEEESISLLSNTKKLTNKNQNKFEQRDSEKNEEDYLKNSYQKHPGIISNKK
jgi:hypothetical protein